MTFQRSILSMRLAAARFAIHRPFATQQNRIRLVQWMKCACSFCKYKLVIQECVEQLLGKLIRRSDSWPARFDGDYPHFDGTERLSD